jgi:hypothetical protein
MSPKGWDEVIDASTKPVSHLLKGWKAGGRRLSEAAFVIAPWFPPGLLADLVKVDFRIAPHERGLQAMILPKTELHRLINDEDAARAVASTRTMFVYIHEDGRYADTLVDAVLPQKWN